MKKVLLTSFGLLSIVFAQAQEMNVHKIGGTIVNIKLADIEKITFSDGAPDIDNNVYKTVQIGTQIWMAENLKVTKYKNGDPIDATQWSYPTNSSTTKAEYGLYYKWNVTIDPRGVCPTGWHVPTNAEWTTLDTYLGGETVAGGKLKATGTTNWKSPNTGATNESGFNSLPAGYREGSGSYSFFKERAYYWSSTANGVDYGYFREQDYTISSTINNYYDVRGHMSIRCVKD